MGVKQMSAGSKSGHSVPSQLFFFPLFCTTATTTGVAAERLPCPLPSGLAALCPLPRADPKEAPGGPPAAAAIRACPRTSHPQGPQTRQVPCHRTPQVLLCRCPSTVGKAGQGLWAQTSFQAKGVSKPPSSPQPLEEAREGSAPHHPFF